MAENSSDSTLEQVLLTATGRKTLADAIAWIAEGHPLRAEVSLPALLQATVRFSDGEIGAAALRRIVREACASEVDTARVVFDPDSIRKPQAFRGALDELISRSPNGELDKLTPRLLLRAQYANHLAIETLCLMVGISSSDARDWFASGSSEWTLEGVTKLLEYLRMLVNDEIKTPIANSAPAKALELLFGDEGGWGAIEKLCAQGVPYEVLLAQRAAGGPWLAHKNRTSSFPNIAAADLLCGKLAEKEIEFLRATAVGGSARQTDLQRISGIPKQQITVVVMKAGKPTFAVAFSSARDGGTARANGDGLLQIPVTELPMAIVLTGLGWAGRPETDRLALQFGGLLFTERTIDHLVAAIEDSLR